MGGLAISKYLRYVFGFIEATLFKRSPRVRSASDEHTRRELWCPRWGGSPKTCFFRQTAGDFRCVSAGNDVQQ